MDKWANQWYKGLAPNDLMGPRQEASTLAPRDDILIISAFYRKIMKKRGKMINKWKSVGYIRIF